MRSDQELLAGFVRTRDPALREELAGRYGEMAERLALRYRDRGEQLEDLKQVALLGLLKALDGFDDTRGTSFEAYATPTILGELRRHFRDHRWSIQVPRGLKEAIPRIRTAIDEIAGEQGGVPDPDQIAERAELEPGAVRDALDAAVASQPRSLDAPVPGAAGEDRSPLGERIGADDARYEQTDDGLMLEQRLARLSTRDREVLDLRFARDLTQSEIAERIDLSQMQVSRIIRSALEKLREPDRLER